MNDPYITVREAVEKYKILESRLRLALRTPTANGLYKVIFRKRTFIYLHKEKFENWMLDHDIVNAPLSFNRKVPKPKKEEKPKKKKWYRKKGDSRFKSNVW